MVRNDNRYRDEAESVARLFVRVSRQMRVAGAAWDPSDEEATLALDSIRRRRGDLVNRLRELLNLDAKVRGRA